MRLHYFLDHVLTDEPFANRVLHRLCAGERGGWELTDKPGATLPMICVIEESRTDCSLSATSGWAMIVDADEVFENRGKAKFPGPFSGQLDTRADSIGSVVVAPEIEGFAHY